MNSLGSWVDLTMRSRVWQLTQLSRMSFCFGVPGMLWSHSALVSWVDRLRGFLSLRSTFAVLSPATSAAPLPSRSKPTARILIAYWPGSSRDAGKLYRPSLLVTTVIAIVEPAFLAVTSTPSIGPSSFEVTWPASAAAPSASDGAALAVNTKVRQTLASSAVRIRIVDPPSEILHGAPQGEGVPPAVSGRACGAEQVRPLKIGRQCAG